MTFRKCHSEGTFSATEESRSIEKLKIPRQSKKNFSVGMTFRKCHSEGAFSATPCHSEGTFRD